MEAAGSFIRKDRSADGMRSCGSGALSGQSPHLPNSLSRRASGGRIQARRRNGHITHPVFRMGT